MRLRLLDRLNDSHVAGNLDKVVGIEVRDTDNTRFAFFVRLFQCATGIISVAERLMPQHQADVSCLQLAQAVTDEPVFIDTFIANSFRNFALQGFGFSFQLSAADVRSPLTSFMPRKLQAAFIVFIFVIKKGTGKTYVFPFLKIIYNKTT